MTTISFSSGQDFIVGRMREHNVSLTRALERLSSGYRINRAADDASGLAYADNLRTQILGMEQASRNIGLAINFIRTAEDGLSEILSLLQSVRTLAIASSNGTLSNSERATNQSEVTELLEEIDRLATAVTFNKIKLLNGTFSSTSPTGTLLGGGSFVGSAVFQVGANKSQSINARIATASAQALGVNNVNISTQSKASSSLSMIDSAINSVLTRRASIGGIERRLQSAQSFVDLQRENHLAAESAIRDADLAAEIVQFTRAQIMVQVSSAVLAQTNTLSSSVLQIFQS